MSQKSQISFREGFMAKTVPKILDFAYRQNVLKKYTFKEYNENALVQIKTPAIIIAGGISLLG